MAVGRQSELVDILRRALAAGSAAMVFALGVFAASPALHEQLHVGSDSALDDGCAIVLFANGVSMPLAMTAPPPPVATWCQQPPVSAPEVLVESPRYLLQPERGPPAA